MIIADDFTGAMDTGVQFVKQGILTMVTSRPDCESMRSCGSIEVLAINTNSRHDSPNTAYQKVQAIIRKMRELKVDYIYKKTDSALRGNIGAELEAVLQESGIGLLPFVPAYPMNNRITVEGCQYVDGLPVNLSKLGQDPFTPVKSALIADVIHIQSEIPVTQTTFWKEPSALNGICVYNASSNEELERIGHTLKDRDQIAVTAGCAGFAEFLPEILGLTKTLIKPEIQSRRILVISGSVSEISICQVDYMRKRGISVATLFELEDPNQVEEMIQAAKKGIKDQGIFILESVSNAEQVEKDVKLRKGDREAVMDRMAAIVKSLLEEIAIDTLFVIGGDTLQSIMDAMDFEGIMPKCELMPGIVFGNVSGDSLQIISKSGSFGGLDVIDKVVNKLQVLEEGSIRHRTDKKCV